VVKALRIALVVLGLAVGVYGVASLTGGWLGEPPWWTTTTRPKEVQRIRDRFPEVLERVNAGVVSSGFDEWQADAKRARERWPSVGMSAGGALLWPRPGREWLSAGVLVAGLALAAFAAWPRRAQPTPRA
jgi:hypothetical protein